VTDADGIVTEKTYDECGRVVSESVKGGAITKTTTTTFDPSGKTLTVTDPDARTTTFGYDAFGRQVLEVQTVAATPVKQESRQLDSLGRPVSTTDPIKGITRTFTYPAGSPGSTTLTTSYGGVSTTVTIGSDGLETSRSSNLSGTQFVRTPSAHDEAGRETAFTVAGRSHTRTFNDAGQLTGWSAPGASATLAYDGGGREATASATFALGGTIDEAYAYSDGGSLTSVKATDGSTLTDFAFDLAGNLTGETITSGSVVTTVGMAYDPASQRILNRSSGGSVETTYTFDALGRRVNQGPLAAPAQESFTYTGTGRLAHYERSAGASATYSYDASGQRTRSVVTSAGVTTTSDFTYEGLSLLAIDAAQAGGASWTLRYVYDAEGRPYGALYKEGANTAVFTIVTSERGDVLALVDAAGTTFASYRYDVWGTPKATITQGTVGGIPAATIASRQPLRYAGYAFDDETQMYYCSARTYDPKTRQFISKDPAKADGEESAYQYCGGDPVGKVDPSGLYCGSAAASYARTWAKSRNPAYHDYTDEKAETADCTNFASQAAFAGGAPMDWTWWCVSSAKYGSSKAWRQSQLMYEHFTTSAGHQIHKYTPKTTTKYLKGVTPGDLLFLDWREGWEVDHTMVVTGNSKSGGTLYSAHDTNTRSKLWTSVWDHLKTKSANLYVVRPY
jgi:RHS repeat-associated protein